MQLPTKCLLYLNRTARGRQHTAKISTVTGKVPSWVRARYHLSLLLIVIFRRNLMDLHISSSRLWLIVRAFLVEPRLRSESHNYTRYGWKVMRLIREYSFNWRYIYTNLIFFKITSLSINTPFPAVLPRVVARLEVLNWDLFQSIRHGRLHVFNSPKMVSFQAEFEPGKQKEIGRDSPDRIFSNQSYYFPDIPCIWSLVDLLRQNPHWWSPINFAAYGVKLDSRMLDKILYVVDKSDVPV